MILTGVDSMLEQRTALQELDWPTVANAGMTLDEMPVAGAWLVGDWEGASAGTVIDAAREALSTANGLVISIGPSRSLIVTADAETAGALEGIVTGPHAIECRCQRAWLRLSGADSRAFLDRRLGVDISHGHFPAGCVAATRLGQVDVLVHAREDGAFDLLPARSFAAALAETMLRSARAEGASLAICPARG
jgi:heterotetrameric sarcosine oxidase gamma subunit